MQEYRRATHNRTLGMTHSLSPPSFVHVPIGSNLYAGVDRDTQSGLVLLTVYNSSFVAHRTRHPTLRHNTTMAHVDEKENIADGLVTNTSFKAPSLSPKKSAPKKKTRSKSIGPGGLEQEEEKPLKASSGNRRKVCGNWMDYMGESANCVVCFCTGCQVDFVVECRR